MLTFINPLAVSGVNFVDVYQQGRFLTLEAFFSAKAVRTENDGESRFGFHTRGRQAVIHVTWEKIGFWPIFRTYFRVRLGFGLARIIFRTCYTG